MILAISPYAPTTIVCIYRIPIPSDWALENGATIDTRLSTLSHDSEEIAAPKTRDSLPIPFRLLDTEGTESQCPRRMSACAAMLRAATLSSTSTTGRSSIPSTLGSSTARSPSGTRRLEPRQWRDLGVPWLGDARALPPMVG